MVDQVRGLGPPKIGSRLALFCIHRVNRQNSRNDFQHHNVSTVNIVLVIIIIIIIFLTCLRGKLLLPQQCLNILLTFSLQQPEIFVHAVVTLPPCHCPVSCHKTSKKPSCCWERADHTVRFFRHLWWTTNGIATDRCLEQPWLACWA